MHLFFTIAIVAVGLLAGWLDRQLALRKRTAPFIGPILDQSIETRFGMFIDWVMRLSLGVFFIATVGVVIALVVNVIITGKGNTVPLGTPLRALVIQSLWIAMVVSPIFFLTFFIWSWRQRKKRHLRSVGSVK